MTVPHNTIKMHTGRKGGGGAAEWGKKRVYSVPPRNRVETEFERMARLVDEKSIPGFKIYILWAMEDSIPNSVPT
jgi:hypothetical protein